MVEVGKVITSDANVSDQNHTVFARYFQESRFRSGEDTMATSGSGGSGLPRRPSLAMSSSLDQQQLQQAPGDHNQDQAIVEPHVIPSVRRASAISMNYDLQMQHPQVLNKNLVDSSSGALGDTLDMVGAAHNASGQAQQQQQQRRPTNQLTSSPYAKDDVDIVFNRLMNLEAFRKLHPSVIRNLCSYAFVERIDKGVIGEYFDVRFRGVSYEFVPL